jgi:hypothetical protein
MTTEEKIFNITLIPYCSMNLIHFHLERKKYDSPEQDLNGTEKKFSPLQVKQSGG